MKIRIARSKVDRRQLDMGPPEKIAERRRRPERRLPKVAEVPFAAFVSAFAALRRQALPHTLCPSRGQ